MTFVLVLIVTTSISYRGIAIDHIGGYASQSECEDAGKAWGQGNEGVVQGVAMGLHTGTDKTILMGR